MTVAAASTTSGTTGNCTWSLDDNGVLTIKGNGAMGNYSRPGELPWGTNIKKVKILSGVTNLGNSAFNSCTKLEDIIIPNSVERIGMDALAYTSLSHIEIPNSVHYIDQSAFIFCKKLSSITIPNSVVYIGSHAFWTCTVTVKDGSTTLKNGTDYSVAYSKNINVGTATAKITYKGNYTGTVAKDFTIKAKSIPSATVTLSQTSYTYDGTAKKPTVTVKDGSTTLKNGTHYSVAYSKNINAGTATAKITYKGNYKGSESKEFTIAPFCVRINEPFQREYSEALQAIYDGIVKFEPYIDISQYKIPTNFEIPDNFEKNVPNDTHFKNIIYHTFPDLCVLEGFYKKSTTDTTVIEKNEAIFDEEENKYFVYRQDLPFELEKKDGYYTKVIPIYAVDKPKIDDENEKTVHTYEEIEERRQRFEACADDYLSGIDPTWSDLQKTVYLHDKICERVVYRPAKLLKYRTYQTMTEGVGNCYGRALTLSYLLSKLNIPSEVVGTNKHMLNKVQIDGKWYVLDPTWDDENDNNDGTIDRSVFW